MLGSKSRQKAGPGAESPVFELDDRQGFVRVRDARVFHAGNRAYCRRLIEDAAGRPGVLQASVDLDSASCRIDFPPGSAGRSEMAGAFAAAVLAASTAAPRRSAWGSPEKGWGGLVGYPVAGSTSVWETPRVAVTPIEPGADPADHGSSATIPVATGPKRLYYLAMGVGSVAVTGVAIVIPGVPTVPFLMASSYYLARSSPRLDARLRHVAFFGPILREMEDDRALSRTSKLKLVGFTVAAISLTLATTTPSLPFVIVLVAAAGVSVAFIGGIPGIEDVGEGRPLAPPSPAFA